jgi:chromosome segregation ATPase
MKDNIKEILKDNDELLVRYKDNSFESFDTLPINVLDYITNLQTIEQQYSAILSENAELENKITNLQEELKYQKEAELEYNEKHTELMNMYSGLKAENETLRSDFKNQVECATNLQEENERLKLNHKQLKDIEKIALSNSKLIKEINVYKSRIDKAIDKLYCYGEIFDGKVLQQFQQDMLNILQGEDNEGF